MLSICVFEKICTFCKYCYIAAVIARRWLDEGGPWLFEPSLRESDRYEACKYWMASRWRPHVRELALRHTCASRALRNGATLEDICRLLGHSSITQTERYALAGGQALAGGAGVDAGQLAKKGARWGSLFYCLAWYAATTILPSHPGPCSATHWATDLGTLALTSGCPSL